MASNAISIQFDAGVDAALRGEGMSGFEDLYLKYRRRVYSICLRMMANVAEAEDLTQEIFIHLHRKLGSFRAEAAFTTWLHRLTVNQVLMYFRRRSARRMQPPDDGEMPDVADPATLSPKVNSIIDRLALEQAIGRLAPGYRAVFVLCDIEGHNHEEAAKLLGCSIGTSKSQLHKARMRLRQLLVSEPVTLSGSSR
jgi:RNA polymerase sigma-70 factor (ECF subfamily)